MARAKPHKRSKPRPGRQPRPLYRDFAAEAAATPIEPEEDPRVTVLDARRRHHGITREQAELLLLCEPAGCAINRLAAGPDKQARHTEAMRLWGEWIALDAAHAAFMRRIVGKPRHPLTMRLELLADRLETRPEDSRPYRTAEQMDADARAAWARWSRRLSRLRATEQIAIKQALYTPEALYRDGGATTAGETFVRALRFLVGAT